MPMQRYDNLTTESLESQAIDSNVVLDDETIAQAPREQPRDGYYRFAKAMVDQARKDGDLRWFRSGFGDICCDVLGLDAEMVYRELRRREGARRVA